jgi:hypothetical protein
VDISIKVLEEIIREAEVRLRGGTYRVLSVLNKLTNQPSNLANKANLVHNFFAILYKDGRSTKQNINQATNYLAQKSRGILEKLMVPHLDKRYFVLHRTQKWFITDYKTPCQLPL